MALRSLSAVACAVVAGCSTAVPVAETTRMAAPSAWVAVVPRTVRASPEFARLVQTRKAEYSVEVVEYDAESGDPHQRLQLVRSTLARVNAGAEGVAGYVLLVGGPDALPMGPWRFEGLERPVLTDFPIVAELPTSQREIPATAWQTALQSPPRWFVGRVPFDEPARAVRMIELGNRQMDASAGYGGSALLSSGGIIDGWLLANARDALRHMGWEAQLLGPSGSCDMPAPTGVLPFWEAHAPRMAVLAAQTQAHTEASVPPAIVVSYADGSGEALDAALPALIERGWMAGGVAFTGEISATPLTAAWRTTALLPADLASGAPLGNSAEAARRRYWAQAGRDWGIVLPGASQWRAINALSAVVLGDPALRAAGTPTSAPIAAAAPPRALLVPPYAPTVPTPGAAAEPTGPADPARTDQPAGSGLWPRAAAAIALALFLLAVMLWLTSRRTLR